ncbi:MAG TPA: AzlD domain-containing protein [Chloroflexi bacterium]|nr:AzlD domain-containing protein [Chloroflexota bacterium]
MSQNLIDTLTIVGMMLVTVLPRVLPLWLLSQKPLPPLLARWLSYVPVAVLSAMLFPALLMPEGSLALRADNLYLWAAIPAILAAWKTRNLFLPVLAGVATIALLRWVV